MKRFVGVIVVTLLCMLTLSPNRVQAEGEQDGVQIVVDDGTTKTGAYGNIAEDQWQGAYLSAYNQSTINITTGDIEVTSQHEGVLASANSGSTIIVDSGNISAKNDNGVEAFAAGTDTSISIVAHDVTTASTVNDSDALNLKAGGSGNVTVKAGDLKSDHGDGIETVVYDGGTINVKAASITADGNGIFVNDDLSKKGTITVNVEKDIKADISGIKAVIPESAMFGSDVQGSITATNGAGIELNTRGGIAAVNVAEDVTGNYAGANVGINKGISKIKVDGTIKGEEEGIYLWSQDEGTQGIVAKNITSDDGMGIVISTWGNTTAIVSADVISSADNSVSIAIDNDSQQISEKIDVYAWKIDVNTKGDVAEKFDRKEGELVLGDADEKFEKNNVHYFIKLEQPTEGGSIAATNEKGEALPTTSLIPGGGSEDEERLSYAQQDQIVLLKVNLEEGYKLDAAYGNDGKTQPLLFDGENYYIVVPKGGGVYLSVVISANQLKIIDETKDPHEIGGGQSHFVEVDADINDFKQALIDNVDVTKHATVTKGSTIVTFDPSFLDTLSVGEHDLMLKFRLGIASTKLRVIDNNPDNNPSSDSNNTGFAIPKTGIEDMQKTSSAYKGYMIASFAVAVAIVTFKRNRKNLVK